MGFLGQVAGVPSVLFSLALATALLCIAGLVAARWSRTRARWGPARCAARRVRSALLIASCVGFAAFGLLQGYGYFSSSPPYGHHQQTAANVNALLLFATICAAVVELIVARTEHPERSAPPPIRPDLPSRPF